MGRKMLNLSNPGSLRPQSGPMAVLASWPQTGSETFTPDVGSKGAQLAEAAGDLQGAVSPEQDVLHRGRVDLVHQDVGHPLRAALHLLQDLREFRVVQVVS